MIEDEIRKIVDATRSMLSVQDVINASDLLEHGEYGEALSLVCTQIYEYEAVVSREIFEKISAAGEKMQMPPEEWMMLNELVK